MKLSYLYGGLAVAFLCVGMFLSDAPVSTNLACLLAVVILSAVSLFYLIRENPPQSVDVGTRDPAEVYSTAQRRAEYDRVKDLSRRMRNEPDPEVYALMRAERTDLARRIGL